MTVPPVFAVHEGAIERYGDIGDVLEQNGTHLLFVPSNTPPLETERRLRIQQGIDILRKLPPVFGHSRTTEQYANLRSQIDILGQKSVLEWADTNNLTYAFGYDAPKRVPSYNSLSGTYKDLEKKLVEQKGAKGLDGQEKVAFLVGHYSLNEVIRYETSIPKNDAITNRYTVRRHGIGLGRVLEPFGIDNQVSICAAIGFTLVTLYNQAQR